MPDGKVVKKERSFRFQTVKKIKLTELEEQELLKLTRDLKSYSRMSRIRTRAKILCLHAIR